MVFGSHAKRRAMYSIPPCPSLAASTAAYRRRSFSDSHPKNRCIFCSTSAVYTSMPHSLIQDLLRGKDTTASAIRKVILHHILSLSDSRSSGPSCTLPYRDCRRQKCAASLTTMDWANSLAVSAARLCGLGRRRKVSGVGLREFHDDCSAYPRCAGEMQGALVTIENLLTDRQ